MMNTTTTIATTIENATTLSAVVSAPFVYKKKNEEGKMVEHTTTMLKENFSRLPDSKTLKQICVYKYIHAMYNNACQYATVKGDNQRKKYADRLEESVKEWAEFVGIPTNDLTGLYMACGLKKSKTKGEIDSALPSESTFIKSMLFVTHTRVTKNVWQSKPVKTDKNNVSPRDYDLNDMFNRLVKGGKSEKEAKEFLAFFADVA